MKINLSKSIRLTGIIFCALVAFLLASVAIFSLTRYSWPPDIQIVSSVSAPGNQWLAIIETEEYKSMFTPPYYAVVLRSQTGWFQKLREKKIFEVCQKSADQPPAVKWRDANVLDIETSALKGDIAVQLHEINGIKISYAID